MLQPMKGDVLGILGAVVPRLVSYPKSFTNLFFHFGSPGEKQHGDRFPLKPMGGKNNLCKWKFLGIPIVFKRSTTLSIGRVYETNRGQQKKAAVGNLAGARDAGNQRWNDPELNHPLLMVSFDISTLGMVAKSFAFCRPPVKMNRTKKNMPRTVKLMIHGMRHGLMPFCFGPNAVVVI